MAALSSLPVIYESPFMGQDPISLCFNTLYETGEFISEALESYIDITQLAEHKNLEKAPEISLQIISLQVRAKSINEIAVNLISYIDNFYAKGLEVINADFSAEQKVRLRKAKLICGKSEIEYLKQAFLIENYEPFRIAKSEFESFVMDNHAKIALIESSLEKK